MRMQIAMAAAGAGFTVLPYSAIAEDAEAGRLVAVPIEALQIYWTLVHAKERALSVAAQRLTELLLSQVEQRVASGRWRGFVPVPTGS